VAINELARLTAAPTSYVIVGRFAWRATAQP
jgi:hypothetical protein